MGALYDEMVAGVTAAFNDRDFSQIERWAHEDAVFDWSRSIGDNRGVHEGRATMRGVFESFLEAWESVDWQVAEVDEIDADRVLLSTRIVARGRGSGIEIDAGGAQLWELRDGRIAQVTMFQNREDAWLDVRRRRLDEARLYFVCDGRPRGEDPKPLLDAALRGGADLIQLRDKDLADEERIEGARPFRRAADEHGALFVLNDRPDLVAACEADGVHVGQDDMPVAEARETAGTAALVGLSTHSEDQVRAAHDAQGEARPDYISVGPVWETPTKEGRPATGLGLIEFAAANADLPWFAIGGIDTSNVGEVAAAGAGRIVVVRAIRDAGDPEASARSLREALTARAGARS